MHLLNRNLFVMWDGYIRDEYEYGDAGEDYVDFLKQMQEKFKDIEWDMPDKSFTKVIDEYNYVTISLPELEKNRKKGRLTAHCNDFLVYNSQTNQLYEST